MAYREDFRRLFPGYRAVGTLYLLQLLELPYLFRVGDPDALFYANAFALLIYTLMLLFMCEAYFYPHNSHKAKDYWMALPAVAALLPLLLQAVGAVSLPAGFLPWAYGVVSILFLVYLWLNVRMALRIGRTLRQVDENTYADSDDFPVRIARYLQWIPTIICLLLALNFLACDPWVKMVRDLLFACAGVAFCIFTLNPHRKVFSPEEEKVIEQLEQDEVTHNNRLDDSRCDDLRRQLEHLLVDEHIFTEPHITSDLLISRLGINATYLTEVIRRSGYSSFYDMINRHRVDHAIGLIRRHPDQLLSDIADRCGFSSQASMAKAFKSQGKPTPSTFRKETP